MQQPSLLLDPQRFDDLQLLRSLYVLDFLDFDGIPTAHGSMVANIGLVPCVEEILHTVWVTSTTQDTVAPGRVAPFLGCIIFVRAAVVFVRWGKGD